MISTTINFAKSLPKTFAEMDIWQKSLSLISTLFFLILFVENFVLSQSFSALQLREIDDLAFQAILREIHQDFSSFHLDRIFRMNYYGYGWSFWIIFSVLTYPFYLIAQLSGFFMPLIILPRMLSLAFVIGTTILVYKSLSIYSKNEFLKFIAILLLLSFPAFGSFGLYFRTTAQVMFFSALTFYLAISKETYDKKDLKNIALAAGLCAGTKLNGLMILPVVGIIMLNRLQWSFTKENFIKATIFISWLLLFVVVFSNPMLLIAPFKPKYLFKFIDSLQYNSHMGWQDDFIDNLSGFIEVGYVNLVIAVAFVALPFFSKNNKKRDLIFIVVWLIVCSALLAEFMMMGKEYMVNYFTVVAFLAVFSVIAFDGFGKIGNLLAVLLLALSIILNWHNIALGLYSPLKFFYIAKSDKITAKISAIDEMRNLIESFDQKATTPKVFMDSLAVFPHSNLANDNVEIHFTTARNLLGMQELEINFDYIVLDRGTIYFLSDSEFEIAVTQMNGVDYLNYEAIVADRFENRKLIKNLLATGKINGSSYQNIFDKNDIILLKKISS